MKLTLKLYIILAIVAVIGYGMYKDGRPVADQPIIVGYPMPDTLHAIPDGCGVTSDTMPDTLYTSHEIPNPIER